jgi:hypothetical protein
VTAELGEAAAGIDCALVERELVGVDGRLDDWEGIEPGGEIRGADATLAARCAIDGARLLLAVSVRDPAVVRTGRRGRPGQDELLVRLGAKRLRRWTEIAVAPGTRGFEVEVAVDGERPRGGAEVVDSLQDDGWAVEIALPLARVAGYGEGTPALRYELGYRDAGGGRRDQVTGAGALYFPGAREALQAFARQVGIRPADVSFDVLADVVGGPGLERVMVAGRVLGVLDESYRYASLPLMSPADLLAMRVEQLSLSGPSSIVTHYREHGNGGSREVVAVWNVLDDGRFQRTLAVEVAKRAGGAYLTNRWRLVPRAGKPMRGKQAQARPGGQDLVVEVAEVAGWDESSYADVPPEDMRPILTPWGGQRSAVYHFEGVDSYGGEPL